VLRILHSRSVAEADTEAVAVVVSMEVVAEAASTVAAVVVADSMEAVAEVFTAEAAERIAAVAVVRTAAADRRVTLLAAWVPMDAGAAACMAERVRMARTAERVRME
jgi:KaiC/GvpD/RAD55 family RecA-like ATPase